jgi:hypothetical protein
VETKPIFSLSSRPVCPDVSDWHYQWWFNCLTDVEKRLLAKEETDVSESDVEELSDILGPSSVGLEMLGEVKKI